MKKGLPHGMPKSLTREQIHKSREFVVLLLPHTKYSGIAASPHTCFTGDHPRSITLAGSWSRHVASRFPVLERYIEECVNFRLKLYITKSSCAIHFIKNTQKIPALPMPPTFLQFWRVSNFNYGRPKRKYNYLLLVV